MYELDPDAYAKASRRERVRYLLSVYGKVVAGGLLVYGFFAAFFTMSACGCGGPNARRSVCQSNLKQIGLAMTQYEQDNDETQPAYVSTSGQDWRKTLYPYIKSTEVFQCPDDKRGRSHDSPENMPKSYGASHLGPNTGHQERGAFAAPASVPITVAAFGNPADAILVMDTRGYSGPDWNIIAPTFLPGTGRELYAHIPKHPFYKHPSGTLNCLLADGHVKAMKPLATLAPVNLWTRDNTPFVGQDLQNARAILKHAEDE